MEEQRRKKVLKKRRKKKPFIERNLKTIAVVFVVLFVFQSMRGCVKSTSYERELTTQTNLSDSIIVNKDNKITGLDSVIEVKKDFIQYLEYELKIAGVKVQAADDRADAVQRTAERVKNNNTTTIQILTDTSRTSVIEVPDSLNN